MIIHDYQCQVCEEITEHFITDSSRIPDQILCPICNGYADRIVSLSQTSPVDASWIGTVREVVDKNPDKPHCQEFLRHPTRANYKAWMKGEGLRPLEPGESAMPKVDKERRRTEIKKGMLERHMERNSISVNTNTAKKEMVKG